MRTAVKKVTEWTHITLILAILMPMVYTFGAEQPDLIGRTLYLRCLVIALPIIASDLAVGRCRSLLSYLIASALLFAATVFAGQLLISPVRGSSVSGVYMTFLIIETGAVLISRIAERLNRKKAGDAAKNRDPSWRPAPDTLRTPSLSVLIFFGAVYALALNLNNPAVCSAALFSALFYAPAALLHKYICETENYLSLNKRTCNLPSGRIYGIGAGMLAIFLLLFIAAALPALMTVSGRHYRDIRKSMTPIEFDYPETTWEMPPEASGEDPVQALIERYGEPKPTPPWLTALSRILEAAALAAVAAGLLKVVFGTFRAFREAADENGDIVEELQKTEPAVRIKKAPAGQRRLSERERIRKEYRKTIRKYRKDRPERHETPTEIEKNAGIAQNTDIQRLHDRYELARYGQAD